MASTSANVVEKSLQSIWSHVLNLPHVDLDQPFLSVGGDSISAMQVVGQCRKEGMSVGVQDVLRCRSISQLSLAVKELEDTSFDHEEYFDEEFDLTPIQYLYFQRPNTNGHFNQSFYLRVTRRTTVIDFRAAVEQLISRHSMLRARFSHSSEHGWRQRLTNDIAGSYRFRHAKVASQAEIDSMIENSQQCFDHVHGPLFAADFFDFGDEQFAFLTGHHLVVDLVTWRLLLEELEELLKGQSLLAPALPFQKWAELQSDHADTLELDEVLPPVDVPQMDFSYWGIQHSHNTYGNAGHSSFELDADLSLAFLTNCHDAYRTEPVEVLLASLIQSWSNVFKDRPVPAIFNEGHGREPWSSEIDITRTVGWFTALSPILVAPAQDPTDTVRRIKDYKRRIPGNGRPYFARRCLTDEGRQHFSTHWPMEILFNYLGQYQQLERADALLQPLGTMAGETGKAGGTSDFGSETCRWGLFEISAFVFKGHLKFAFTYNRHMRHQGLVQQWITECRQTITSMIEQLVLMDHKPTLSDFPLLSLTEDSFSNLMHRLSNMGVRDQNVEDIYPCSSMQEGLLLSQTKDAGFYAAATLHEIISPTGYVPWETVARGWEKVVYRHPALRTIFLENVGDENGLYNQIVLKDIEANIIHLHCADEASAIDAIEKQRSTSYADGLCPNHRFTVCTTDDKRTFCSLEISHAVMDGHSMSLLASEIRQACAGQLTAVATPYSDYISWYMKQSQEDSLQFWKSYLSGSEVCSFPPLNDGQIIGQEKRLVTIRMDLSRIGLPDLQEFCNANGITLSNVFHTAWALTISNYIGSSDVTFGYLTSARDSDEVPGVDEMVGPIINTLVCRVNMSDTARCLLDVLQDVQRDYMEAIPHRHVALADVQHALELSGASLFNTALSYRRLPQEEPVDTTSLRMEDVRPIYDPTEYPVSINIEVGDVSAAVDLDYWTDFLSAQQATNVADTFVQALENIMYNAKRSLSTLNHLSLKHLNQIENWNIMPATINECVQDKFATWVEAQPDAPAIVAHDGQYSYLELDRISTQLAHHLVRLGVGPEIFVPTCFDKSAFAIIAMLSVLKAGGAAVPLDATHPATALKTRIQDAGSKVVLTSSTRAEKFAGLVPEIIVVDSAFLESLPQVKGPACTTVAPHNPCFVIFTSGSTGRPKGVVLEHSAIVTSAEAHGSKIGLGVGSRMLQFASYTFDNSLEEMFTTLQRGGCVCVPSEADRVNDLAGVITRLNVNIMDLTPTVAALLQPTDVPTVKRLCLGAEPLTKALVDTWSPHVIVMGQYGPSEASINSAFKDFTNGGEATNIGKAVGCVTWVIDPNNRDRLMPIGCKGELILEGPILSRGYLNDPEKTNAVFIMDPEWACNNGKAGRRFYCTGDLVQYTSDGDMMYLGRKDNQVKLHGQRIELGEIEHHLRLELPANAKSAVELVKFNDANSTKALVAFMCFEDEQGAASESEAVAACDMNETVRARAKRVEVALANALPSYYVPSMFIPVTRMPMTTSGKLDRKVLRALPANIPEVQLTPYRLAGKSGRAPSGPVELTLAQLWASVLKLSVDAVGAEDSFFRLGGDSITAMRLVTAARNSGIILNVANVFAYPKLQDLAATTSMSNSSDLSSALNTDVVPFELISKDVKHQVLALAAVECGVDVNDIEDIFPCSKLQEGLIMLSSKDPGTYVVQPIYRLPADIDIPRFKATWNAVIAAEGILRTRIIFTDQYGFLQVVVREAPYWHSLQGAADINDATRHLPAKNGGRLTTFAIAGEGTDSQLFVWTAHHAVYDGWSWAALFRKVETVYNGTHQSVPASIPYAKFVKYLTTLDQKESDDFWLSNLDNMTAPQFPLLPSPDHRVEANGQLLRKISITRDSNIEVTMPSMLRAAWGLVLASYSGSDDVLWGETNSGREAAVDGIDSMIGPTITTAPVRLRLNRQMTIHEYLKETQKQSSISLPYQFAGLQHIRKLSAETAIACDFQSFLGIEAGEDLADAESALWHMQSANTIGTDFFSYAFIFNCKVTPTTVHIECLYDNRVVEPWLVKRIVDQYEFVLQQLNSVQLLDQKLDVVNLINPADHQTIAGWNKTPVPIVERCIHSVIAEDQVALRPLATAIDAWDIGVLSYLDLDEKSTALAHRLQALGVKPNQFVPICFDKSGWTIIAILAILKAGAAFVPLDFEAPILRLRELVKDVDADLILCGPRYEALCQSIPCNALVVDEQTTTATSIAKQRLPVVRSDSIAYAFYTSGSTGKPKGAVINHHHWVTSSNAFSEGWRIKAASRVLQFASYIFDACLIEIFSTLMSGGTICVPDQASRTNDLVGVINKMNVNWAALTPSIVRMMQPSQVPQLKTLFLVGEAMSQQDLHTWADKVTLGNGYGPTECACVATFNIMTATTKPNNLGKAATARGWVVKKDNHDMLVPIGAVGELLLEGGGVGVGYLHNPEKTAQAFIGQVTWSDGLLHDDKIRIYKTGDLVKYNEDGTMLYLGRKDSQAKVRGQRLELSEVEHHLMDDILVQNALAAVPTSGPCTKRLVGVIALQDVLPTGDQKPLQILPQDISSANINTIRDRLCERLPAYMIPSLWIAVARFPLMPSGKMDRRRVVQWLEQMDQDTYRAISTAATEGPQTDASAIELKLQAIFANVLNLPLEDIRLNQSFLHLGGDSIAAMQVSSQCRAQDLPISVQEIIRAKSIAALASQVDISPDLTSEVPQALEHNQPFELSPIQRLFFETMGDSYNYFNQAEIFRLSKSFDRGEIQNALTALVNIHPMLRARFARNDSGEWQQRIEKDAEQSFRLRHHRVSKSDDTTMRPILDESQATLDIINGPTFAIDVFDVQSNGSYAIALVAHHLVIDVVSWGVLLEDLQSLLSGSKPPPQSLSFYSWLQQQATQARQDTATQTYPLEAIAAADYDFWGMTNRPNLSGDTIEEEVKLSPRDTMLLLGAQDALATEILDILVAALFESFRKVFPSRSTITIHNEGHGRETFTPRQDLSRTIGWFSTVTPISLPVSSEESTDMINTIRWVKDVRERTPDKGRPYFAFRNLTEEGRTRFASHWPAEAVFNYLGRIQTGERKDALFLTLEGIDSREIGVDVPRMALFDITAAINQGAIRLSFGWNKHMKHQAEIRTWVTQCRQTLMDAIDELLQVEQSSASHKFNHMPLLYNGASKLSAALPAGMAVADIEDVYPTAPMQQGLLMAQSKNPDLYTYHALFEVQSSDAKKPVDVSKIAEAWQTVVHRHSALRTIFVDSLAKNGSKDQIVLKQYVGRTEVRSDCDDKGIVEMLRAQPSIDCRDSLPPHRMTICQTKLKKVWVKLELSHAINDGTSISNILNDLSAAYAGQLSRTESGPLYSDYMAYILSTSRDADLAYWKKYLSGVEPCFFPTLNDGKSSAHESGSLDVHLGSTKNVQVFCKKYGVTMSNVLQLTWALTLHCYVGASDVSFGLVASGRDVPVKNIDEAVGCFVNMLVARLSFTDETTIAKLLEDLQTASTNALSHQTCPLADIQHELQLPSLFNTAFTFQRRSISRDPEETALLFENMEAADSGEYAITINADVTDDEVTVDFGFWKDKVMVEQAQNMADTFKQILNGIIACNANETTVGKLDWLTPNSLQQVMAWNTTLPAAIRRCLHDVIHEQALTRPRTTKAVEGWDGTFTYQEFDKITDQLAVHLQAQGVTTETFVPILFEKSSWAIVSMIAIMKAGGAYVPLDPKHPQTRLQELISDVGAKVVLCSRKHFEKASEVAATALIIDQRAVKKIGVPAGSKPKSCATPDNACYCLFTSGTTGKPKGTIIPHQAFVTSAAAFTRRMNINATSRTFQFASYTFDASCIEILSALSVGATVCVPTEDDRMNNAAGAIRKFKANWSLLTPSVLGTIEPDRVPSLKTLVSGGEALPGPILKKWGTSTCFINAYGPTECSVVAATAYKSTLDHKIIETEPGTIGTGSGARLWVAHPRNHDKLMPVGSVGELIIEGPTVARGYLNDGVKTAKAFIENPLWATSLASEHNDFKAVRMYKSGDLVRYNTDGSVSYIGRKDTQIKLNGQRIELGEIEFHVGKNLPDNVQSAVELITPSSRSPAKALAVFFAVVHDQEAEGAESSSSSDADSENLLLSMNDELRDMCKAAENGLGGSLPSYMIPSIFIPVTKMPWTSAGKLDRNRLRGLVSNLDREVMAKYRLTSMANKKQPSTDAERKIQKAVASVLNLPPASIGIDDSFVRLGGDSISAMRLVASAQGENLELSFIDIFKNPRLADLAEIGSRTKTTRASPKPIAPFDLLPKTSTPAAILAELTRQCRVGEDDIQDAYPTSRLQEALLTLSIKQKGAYIAQHILVLEKSLDVAKFQNAWQHAVQETDILRTRVTQLPTGDFIQVVLKEDVIEWKDARSLEEAEKEASNLPKHVGGKLASYTLIRTASGELYFVWTIHHALYDGWSVNLMLQRVEELYLKGASTLPQTPYNTFIQYLDTMDQEASKKFWKEDLNSAAPNHFPQQPVSVSPKAYKGKTFSYSFKLTASKHTDVTISNRIRAAWALLIAAYTDNDDVVFGETLAGRDIAVSGVTDICGPTLTTVPTRIKIDRGATIEDLIHGISTRTTDRIPHQHYGLSALKALGEDASAACDFQNLLVVQNEDESGSVAMWKPYDNGEQSSFFTYPLVLECKMGRSKAEILAHYDVNLITEWQVQRLLLQFEAVLSQLNTIRHVSDVRVFSEQDKQLISQWNGYEPQIIDETVPSIFFKQVERQPECLAVHAFDGDLTYAELSELACMLAQELIKHGAGPETLIPVCLDKSRWAIVAIMAILIAGSAYVPLSPDYPSSRHQQVIEACKASVVVCSPNHESKFAPFLNCIIAVSEATIRQLPACRSPMLPRAKSNNVAYVIFTSGSTGVPKGVVIEHKTIVSSSAAICRGLHITPESRVFQFCSFLFDVSVGETITVLMQGATICVPSEEQRLTDLANAITRLRATWAFLTPSVASILEGPEVVPTLETLVTGGEAMTTEVVNKWASALRLYNGYGPTEGAVFAVTNDQVSSQRDPTNIGQMLRSGRAWLTNPHDPHVLAPLGAVAELCLEGALLARGYLNDPERTGEAFIENPKFMQEHTGSKTSRIYRTGDLVQYAADGSIHYLGRKDNQIKLAGQRIEIDEIEHHLQAHEDIFQAVVHLPRSGPCAEKLVAVVRLAAQPGRVALKDAPWNTLCLDQDVSLQLNNVRESIVSVLPNYMLPSVWVPVLDIPILASTKLDKKRVRTWLERMNHAVYQQTRALKRTLSHDSSTALESEFSTLQDIVSKTLRLPVDDVKRTQTWLSLGGDSISAMKLLAQCRAVGIHLTLNQVLRAKSLGHLASSIDFAAVSDQSSEKIGEPFGLSPIQQFYFRSKDVEKNNHFNQSSTMRLTKKIDSETIKAAFDAIVSCHSMLRARFVESQNGVGWQQIIQEEGASTYALHVHNVSSLSSTVPIISDTQKSLNFVDGPVFAVDQFNLPTGDQVLFIVAHHLVIDVVSWGVILGDLEELLASGQAVLPKSLSFQTWCERQQEHAHDARQLDMMREQSFAVEPVDLAYWGMDARANVYGDVERDEFTLDQAISAMALNNHEAMRTDVVDLLLAAMLHSFSRVFINRKTPTIFSESHGREAWESSKLDLSRTVGWFTTMYPVTIPIGQDEDEVTHTVRQVKDARRKISDNGRPYFAHRCLTEDGQQRFAHHETMEVLFNYTGRQQQAGPDDSILQATQFSEDEEEETSDVGPKTKRMALFEISAAVVNGQIQMSFMYSRYMKNRKGIRRWISECQQTLEEIVDDLAKLAIPVPTMADFPLLPIESYTRLDRVLKTLPSAGIPSFSRVEDMYPCSSIQDGMILSQIKSPDSYWSSIIFEVKSKRGSIDVKKMGEAWKMVVNRHPALRTVFVDSVCKGGVFDQVVLKDCDTGLVSQTCSDAEADKVLASLKYGDLNGKKKPNLPHQAVIVQTTSGRTIVKIIVNHAVIDGGSFVVLGQDLQAAYQGTLSREEGPLYSDYIKYLRTLPAKDAITYWKEKLRGVKPCYFPTTPSNGRQGQLRSFDMIFNKWSDLHTLAESNNITFANILLAAWALVLRKYADSDDVCYGYLTSGRNVPVDNIENAVGAFINMLVSRLQVTSTVSLMEIIKTVQTDFVDSMPHQHCSLAQFQHDLGLSGKSLFNTAVSIQNRGTSEEGVVDNADIEFEQLDGQDPSEFAITVNIDATRNDEAVRFTYWSDAVTDGEAKNVSALMAKILNCILSNSKQTLADIDVSTKSRPSTSHSNHLTLPLVKSPVRPSILRSRSSTSNSSTSPPRTPRITFPDLAPAPSLTPTAPVMPVMPTEQPDWTSLIRSIVSEMVPQIVEQIVAKNAVAPNVTAAATSATIDQMTSQMTNMVKRRTSVSSRKNFDASSIRAPSIKAPSIRSRRLSVASNAESRIQAAADMVANIGVLATEASTGLAPDYVEKKLLALWSELLEVVEESIEQDDGFFSLGGDSIIAMRLVGAAREEGLSMTVADVFKNPTFADMARVVRVAGEVIDEVMSRAGGESVVGRSEADGPSRPRGINKKASSIWDDYQSNVSDLNNADIKSVAVSDTPWEQDAKQDALYKKPSNGQRPGKPHVRRQSSHRSMLPQTIQEGVESTPKSISLMGDPNVDSVISKVQVFKGGISDVFPVTDFQALAITGSLLESRWMLNYFYLDGNGPLDLRKLKQAAFRMVQAFDILRTVFVPYGDRFLQVVLRKLQPEFIFQQTDDDLDTFTKDLRQKDRDNGPRLGEAFTQFVIAKQKQTGRYRIFMRLSHAQYDGVCMGKILSALQDGYNGLPVSSAPSFGNFVRESAKTVAGAHDHWREVLRGSKMTEIVNRFGPNYQRSAGKTITLEKRINVRPLSRINITAATIVKAAWSATLARIAGKSDIVFGHVISGRNSGVANVENIVGPCLNMVPVRVVYRPEWTVHDLLKYIQEQQVANMPYESLGFREITRHCTDWPDWTNFSSVLQHDQHIQDENPTMQLGGLEFSVRAEGSQEDFADFSIHSTSRGKTSMDLTLTYAPNTTITAEFAQQVFDILCANVMIFAEDPYAPLPSPSELSSQSSSTLGSGSEKMRARSTDKSPVTLPTDTGLSKHEVSTLATTLRSAWEQILHDEHGAPMHIELHSDFYQLGGDIMGLAQIASILDQEEGFRVRVEDLIDKSLFVDQVGVLAAERKKQIEKERQDPWGDKGKSRVEVRQKDRKSSVMGMLTSKMKLKRKDTTKAP